MRDRVGGDEMLLEPRLYGGLDLVYVAHRFLDFGPRGAVAQRDARAGSG